MARKGRALEKLVALFEQGLAGEDVRVTSPARVRGIISGSLREIDILIEGSLGSGRVFQMVECRDRPGRKGDVTWIEQIAAKMEDVRAQKAMAVSVAGFTAGARRMAEHRCIDLRTTEEASLESVDEWLRGGMPFYESHAHYLGSIEVVLRELPEGEERPPIEGWPTFWYEGRQLALEDIWRNVSTAAFADMRPGLGKVRKAFEISLPPGFQLDTPLGPLDAVSVRLLVELWFEKIGTAPIASAWAYTSDEGEVARAVKFELPVGETPVSLDIVSSPGGDRRLFLTRADRAEPESSTDVPKK